MKVFLRIVTALTTAALFVLAILFAPSWSFGPVLVLLGLVAAFECFQLVVRKLTPPSPRFIGVFLSCVAILALMFTTLGLIAVNHGNTMLLYVIAIVKFSDMGGFAFGLSSARLMKGGNHKMCPSISPNKSWEGLFGSIAASIVMSLAFLPITHYAVGKAIVFGVAAALVGTFGDLVESKFKRWVGVKDSATFMPAGLGGFLDMFDSLIFAPALFYSFL